MLPNIKRMEQELDELLERRNEMATRVENLDKKIDKLETRISGVQDKCKHEPVKLEGYYVCKKCNLELGRECPESPDGMCEFEDEGEEENELCKYCGKPDDSEDEDDEDEDEEGDEDEEE